MSAPRVVVLIGSVLLAGCAAPSQDVSLQEDEVKATRPLVIGTWNLEYFGSPTRGPANDALQVANARTVIARLAPDVMGLEEIEDAARLDELAAGLPDYEGLRPSDSRLAVIYKRSRLTVTRTKMLPDIDPGLPPLEVSFSLDGTTELVLVVVHFYPYPERASWSRRQTSAVRLKEYLDVHHPDGMVAVVGDWNDDVDTSIVDGYPTPFAGLAGDATRYTFTTRGLSVAQQGTMTSFPSTIDHHLVTNDLAAHFVAKSAWVERPSYVADYRGTTSDHYPVITRYALPR